MNSEANEFMQYLFLFIIVVVLGVLANKQCDREHIYKMRRLELKIPAASE